jgi:RNA polymerase sigma factor (sigma-70 family)
MDHRTPLSMSEAETVWLCRLPQLYVETVNYLRKAPLTRPKRKKEEAQPGSRPKRAKPTGLVLNLALARKVLVTNERLHEDIVQELGGRFFRKVERGKIWAGTQIVKDKRTKKEKEVACVDCWLSKVHKRVARELACTEARQYLYRNASPAYEGHGGEAPTAPELDIATKGASPEQIVSARETLSSFASRLACLPDRERQIFLRHVFGDSHQKIAKDFGMTEAAARTSVHRTRTKLLQQAEETGHKACSPIYQKSKSR